MSLLFLQRSRWLSDPYAKGSYCYHGLDADKLNISSGDFAKCDSTKRLRFAGEATHQRFFSTVHGAIETGFREAKKILDEIN